MARGSATLAVVPLPEARFRKIVEDVANSVTLGANAQQMKSYGFHDSTVFKRPEQYVRYIEPLESELAVQVEYDMDEQDQAWLELVNTERKVKAQGVVSCELFEIIMDRLEKEWFDLTKNKPTPDYALPSEDSTCNICDDSEGENSNAIVFCDGCNLAVHQDCYGVPYIPEGQWLCRKCAVSPEVPVSCMFCPAEGGAFKQTVYGEWAHLLCAIWIPETRVANDTFMEPITDVDQIERRRWKLKCTLCDVKSGACIQCMKQSCYAAFHPTCARREKLLLPMKSAHGEEAPTTLSCFCERHLPATYQETRIQALTTERANELREEDFPSHHPQVNLVAKSARAHSKGYHINTPLVPSIVVERILAYISKLKFGHKPDLVLSTCKYWSLKREARRGAPLLKRLHLEPWTSGKLADAEIDKEARVRSLEYLNILRKDLLKVHDMARLALSRERIKYEQCKLVHHVFARSFYRNAGALWDIFRRVIGLDKNHFFQHPVVREAAPDYFDVIQRPICWTFIEQKLQRFEYWDTQTFTDDVYLVVDNAMVYNQPNTVIHKAAVRIKASLPAVFLDLERYRSSVAERFGLRSQDQDQSEDSSPSQPAVKPELDGTPAPSFDWTSAPSFAVDAVGDLELPLAQLEFLESSELEDAMDLKLNAPDYLESTLSLALAELKPRSPTPLPTPPPPVASGSQKKLTKKEQARLKKAAEMIPSLDASPGFRGPAPQTDEEASRSGGCSTSTTIIIPPLNPTPNPVSPPETVARKQSTRRSSSVLAEIPPIVKDVSSKDSFGAFNTGWILPAGSSRRKRGPDPTPLPTPTRKRASVGLTPTPTPSRKRGAVSMDPTPSSTPSGSRKRPKLELKPRSKLSVTTPATENRTLPLFDGFEAGGSDVGETPSVFSSGQATPSRPPNTSLPDNDDGQSWMQQDSRRGEDTNNHTIIPSFESLAETSSALFRPDDGLRESSPQSVDGDLKHDEDPEEANVVDLKPAGDGATTTTSLQPPDTPSPPASEGWEVPSSSIASSAVEPGPETSRDSILVEELAAAEVLDSAGAVGDAAIGKPLESSEPAADLDLPGALGSGEPSEVAGAPDEEAYEDLDADGSADADGDDDDEGLEIPSAAPYKGPQYILGPVVQTDSLPKSAAKARNSSAPSMASPSKAKKAPKGKQAPKLKAKKTKAAALEPEVPPLTDSELRIGTLVWAKSPQYPFWPAAIGDPEEPTIRSNKSLQVARKKQLSRVKDGKKLHLVQFYEDKPTCNWIQAKDMKRMCDYPELDQYLLAHQKFPTKGLAQRSNCKAAYELATSQMETEDEADGMTTADEADGDVGMDVDE